MLRKQVAELGRSYGREYYVKKANAGQPPTELWEDVARQGFVGVNTPKEYGGGGLGIYELHVVCEELTAAGCPLLGRLSLFIVDGDAAGLEKTLIPMQLWGTPIATHRGLAHPMAQAKIEVELARLMTMKAAWLFDQGHDAGEAANMAKFAAAEASLGAIDNAIQVHGGNGMSEEYGIAALWGMARTLRIAPASREMILNFVAQHSLGLPKSYRGPNEEIEE